MPSIFSRTELLFGQAAMERLSRCRVAVFGIGGVGGYVVEALTRSGVGSLDLVDHDSVDPTNLNRQIIALHSTIGRDKTEVAAARIRDINPDCEVRTHRVFFLPETADQFDFSEYDYVVDAIDTVTGKLELIRKAKETGTPVISSMGTGNKLDPTKLEVADLYETSVCPLAKVMRHECKKRGIDHLKVVYSRELPRTPQEQEPQQPEDASSHPRRSVPGSISFVPSVAGLIIGGEVIRDLLAGG
jgi:tRNA A37 threonylcarbamoyladenosine dehydratase